MPITLMTLGIFLLVMNAVMLVLVAYLLDGFNISGPLPAVAGWLVVTVVSGVGSFFIKD